MRDIRTCVLDAEKLLQTAGISITALCSRAKINPKTWRRWRAGTANPFAPWLRVQLELDKIQAIQDRLADEHEDFEGREG